ncbi:MAG: NAD(+)/NADH kinase, partial [Deltaproteobacteria bacterium]|nr:NAD(+)/NADH kinase [Deltaproteobacteria bacterium]
MGSVGIIANPASGKDIRRLVAYGSVFSNREKVNIVKRVLLGLDSTGVEDVFLMPDYYGIGQRALENLNDMVPDGTQDDSTRAAGILSEMDTGCVVVLGGDGTNRVVAKTSGETPLLSIATGTNNVFSCMVEGTLAGIAAGVVAL